MEIEAAREAAIQFLLGRRDRHGWWWDFDTLAGPSDEWVTGYVGAALAAEPEPRARQAAQDAWRLLRRRRVWSGGWGYSRRVPVDADSTIWALRLGLEVGRSGEARIGRALALLDRHVLASGAVATYRSSGPIRWFTGLSGSTSFEGWCDGHVCVTAAAAGIGRLPGRDRVLAFLRSAQAPGGYWPAYWWSDDEYSTMLAAEALARTGDPSDRERVRRAAATMAAGIDGPGGVESGSWPSGSPFGTACAATVVAVSGEASMVDRLERAAGRLLATQDPDGGWVASARLRIPPPSLRHPETFEGWVLGGKGGGSIALDHNRLYTTATVVHALRAVEARLDPSGRQSRRWRAGLRKPAS